MKIHKALKVKNRLAGEVSRLQEILKRENSRRNDNPSTVNCDEVYNQLIQTIDKLIGIKSALAQASYTISTQLTKLAEFKSLVNYLSSLPTRRGPEVAFVGRDQEKLEYQWMTYLSKEDIDERIKLFQDRINSLQDQIDDFNASTEVNYIE